MASYPIIGDTVLYVAKTKPLIVARDNPPIVNGKIVLNPSEWNEEAQLRVDGYDSLIRRNADGSIRVLDTRSLNLALASEKDIESNPLVYLLAKDQLGFDNLEMMRSKVRGGKVDLVPPTNPGFYVPGIQGRANTGLTIDCTLPINATEGDQFLGLLGEGRKAFSIARWIPKDGLGFIGPLTSESSGYHLQKALAMKDK